MAKAKQQPTIVRLASNPLVQKLVAWLLPIIIGYVTRRLTSAKTDKTSRKFVKNKAK